MLYRGHTTFPPQCLPYRHEPKEYRLLHLKTTWLQEFPESCYCWQLTAFGAPIRFSCVDLLPQTFLCLYLTARQRRFKIRDFSSPGSTTFLGCRARSTRSRWVSSASFLPLLILRLDSIAKGYLRRMQRKHFIDSRVLSSLLSPDMTTFGKYVMNEYKQYVLYMF